MVFKPFVLSQCYELQWRCRIYWWFQVVLNLAYLVMCVAITTTWISEISDFWFQCIPGNSGEKTSSYWEKQFLQLLHLSRTQTFRPKDHCRHDFTYFFQSSQLSCTSNLNSKYTETGKRVITLPQLVGRVDRPSFLNLFFTCEDLAKLMRRNTSSPRTAHVKAVKWKALQYEVVYEKKNVSVCQFYEVGGITCPATYDNLQLRNNVYLLSIGCRLTDLQITLHHK